MPKDFFVCLGKHLEGVALLRREGIDDDRRKKTRHGPKGLIRRFPYGHLQHHSHHEMWRGALARPCGHWRFSGAGNSTSTKAWRVLPRPARAQRKNRREECWTPTSRTLSRHCFQEKQRASRNTKASNGSVPSFVSPLSSSLSCRNWQRFRRLCSTIRWSLQEIRQRISSMPRIISTIMSCVGVGMPYVAPSREIHPFSVPISVCRRFSMSCRVEER